MKLEKLGYIIDEESFQICDISAAPFKHDASNQIIAKIVQDLMVDKYGMTKLELPLEQLSVEGQAKCPVFLSSNVAISKVLLICICGAGKIKAGLWSHKVCINDSILIGSVLPSIEWAHKRDFAVLVLNPNYNSPEEGIKISGSDTRSNHIICVWDNICMNIPAKKLAFVAHSCGGYNACELIRQRESEVLQRLKCIAFSDSSHRLERLSSIARKFVVQNSAHWVSSSAPLGSLIKNASVLDQSPDKQQQETKDQDTKHSVSGAKKNKCSLLLCGLFVHSHRQEDKRAEMLWQYLGTISSASNAEYNCIELSAGTETTRTRQLKQCRRFASSLNPNLSFDYPHFPAFESFFCSKQLIMSISELGTYLQRFENSIPGGLNKNTKIIPPGNHHFTGDRDCKIRRSSR
ncbi:hypothetical protein SELMODRAFT_423531 [Selaginella moellendorffii]|uniref:Arb2 domain-containing protein n=1 Tax=Selaginella moellendorffii TaxID=88036 RepID=D8SM03_SELML|nr:hypothetical protein SELMODRAFT_423531 [Selaginella moellendorffii]